MELWNVHEGVTAVVGAQRHFNVLGRVRDSVSTSRLDGRLNGGRWLPVPVNLTDRSRARLRAPGDFNIDKINVTDLRPQNLLELRQLFDDGATRTHAVKFGAVRRASADRIFDLALHPGHIEEFAQVVDGNWRVVRDENGNMCLSIPRSEAGYDRILLFGDQNWTTGYEVNASLTVDCWTHYVHNVGILFKWNPHYVDADRALATEWSTGLGYYASASPGLRLRFGVDVQFDERGRKLGDHVLAERPLHRWRHPLWFLKGCWYLSNGRVVLSQLRPKVLYRFRARVDPECYRLTVWPASEAEPAPQVVAPSPIEHLATGSVGVIAQNAATRIYGFSVRPLTTSASPWKMQNQAPAEMRHYDTGRC